MENTDWQRTWTAAELEKLRDDQLIQLHEMLTQQCLHREHLLRRIMTPKRVQIQMMRKDDSDGVEAAIDDVMQKARHVRLSSSLTGGGTKKKMSSSGMKAKGNSLTSVSEKPLEKAKKEEPQFTHELTDPYKDPLPKALVDAWTEYVRLKMQADVKVKDAERIMQRLVTDGVRLQK